MNANKYMKTPRGRRFQNGANTANAMHLEVFNPTHTWLTFRSRVLFVAQQPVTTCIILPTHCTLTLRTPAKKYFLQLQMWQAVLQQKLQLELQHQILKELDRRKAQRKVHLQVYGFLVRLLGVFVNIIFCQFILSCAKLYVYFMYLGELLHRVQEKTTLENSLKAIDLHYIIPRTIIQI